MSVMTSSGGTSAPQWHSTALKLAAAYNITWGLGAVLCPKVIFQILGVNPLPNDAELLQCLGMMVGACGIGFWCASFAPVRHWPIVLVGFLSKCLGPIGFLPVVLDGRFPWAMGIAIVVNNMIWWIPFVSILLHVRSSRLSDRTANQFVASLTGGDVPSRRRSSQSKVQITVQAPMT